MIPEEPQVVEGISRRRMLKRIGAGAAVAWSAPILTSIRTPAFAQSGGSPCDPSAQCDLSMPCNVAIACHNGNPACNCWVNADHNACFCGDFDACSNHQACGPGNTCPSGQTCIENCCGLLCYAPCSSSRSRAPKKAGRAYGVR
jgi:hypothetical protein